MSRKDVEAARAIFQDFLAGKSEVDAAGGLVKLAGEDRCHPDVV